MIRIWHSNRFISPHSIVEVIAEVNWSISGFHEATPEQIVGHQLCNIWALRYKYHQLKTWWGWLNPSSKVRRQVQSQLPWPHFGLVFSHQWKVYGGWTLQVPGALCKYSTSIHSTRCKTSRKPGHNENSIWLILSIYVINWATRMAELMIVRQVGNWLGLFVMESLSMRLPYIVDENNDHLTFSVVTRSRGQSDIV